MNIPTLRERCKALVQLDRAEDELELTRRVMLTRDDLPVTLRVHIHARAITGLDLIRWNLRHIDKRLGRM